MIYRREIDGLRAVAILPVILFHSGFSIFSGGYVGVDIFFVITGYLITRSILSDKQKGRFSIADFYRRRARRILPALILVIFCSLPFAWLWMVSYQLENLAASVIAVCVFASNILFWTRSGYFSPDSGELPLLHTWSLATEEQFYLLFPLLLLLLWRQKRRDIFLVLAVLAIASLGLSEWAWRNVPSANFYLMPTRAWEFLVGALVAVYEHGRSRSGPCRQGAAAMGLVLILVSIFLLDETTATPSLWSLLPVGGTTLILVFATKSTWVAQILSLRAFVGIGLVSYSAYLWHQPLFAFARIRSDDKPHQVLMVVLAVASLLLAWASWFFVEQPCRDRRRVSRRHLVMGCLLATGCMIAISTLVLVTKGWPERYPEYQQQFVADSPASKQYEARERYADLLSQRSTPEPKRSLLLIGDSFSQDLLHMILETGSFKDFEISRFSVSAKCQIYHGSVSVHAHIARHDWDACAEVRFDQASMKRIRSADVVILASSWRPWAVDLLSETVQNLDLRSDQELYILGLKNLGHIQPGKLTKLREEELTSYQLRADAERLSLNRRMAETLPTSVFINLQEIICGTDTFCPIFDPAGRLLSYDGSHLSSAGAAYVGRLLFQVESLGRFRGR